MSNIAIKVENLSKLYRLGEVGTGTISQDLNRWWAGVRGKEDPFATIGETNDRASKGNSDFVWSLKDINFEVRKGEVLGIIGRNGAGKSTLLKILSKITAPTTGNVKISGRIASLLEVGTGFHPELTGRENIFLNGAILGMNKAEIRSKFDEIVDFSGVERYIDTPVKRYSSGMYVRLAFAVAAFLEPEILIVDEVLAVGDAEFQKKCIGRMKDVSINDGRTVLFVSHNMGAVKSLCNEVIILKNGGLSYQGNIEHGIENYMNSSSIERSTLYVKHKEGVHSYFLRIEITDAKNKNTEEFRFDENVFVNCTLKVADRHSSSKISLRVSDKLERVIFTSEVFVKDYIFNFNEEIGIVVKIPANLLVPNSYRIQMALHTPNVELIELLQDVLYFNIVDTGTEFYMYGNVDYGCVFAECDWKLSA